MNRGKWIRDAFPIGHRGLFPHPETDKLAPATVVDYDRKQNGRAGSITTGVRVKFDDGMVISIDWIVLNILSIQANQIDRFLEAT